MVDSGEQTRKATQKVLAGIVLVSCLGFVYYLFGTALIRLAYDYFGIELALADIQIAFIILVLISVKVAWKSIEKRAGDTGP